MKKDILDNSALLERIKKNYVKTYQDGRKKIEDLYESYLDLIKTNSWNVETVANSKCVWQEEEVSFPILAFSTKLQGPAIYILSGIHGEEPTGPNAIAESIEILKKIGQKKPVVLIPLCNPQGYFRNWRYLNVEKYTASPLVEPMSVGDSEHFLLDLRRRVRKEKPSNSECLALSKYILKISKDFPPVMSFDFHGDVLIPKAYLYSQGKNGIHEPFASEILNVLEKNGIPVQWNGKTRFGEEIHEGKVGPQADGSVDELISAKEIFVNGKIKPGPAAEKVFVLEMPDANFPLPQRVRAYSAVISFLNESLI